MSVTAQKCIDHIKHALGGSLGSLVTAYDIINQAGELLLDMHPWRFASRIPTLLSLTADQDYVLLPSDLVEISDLRPSSSLDYSLTLTTLAEINRLRSTQMTSTAAYWAALNIVADGSSLSTADLQPIKRLEIWPTPVAGDGTGGEFTLIYRGSWPELDSTNDRVQIPDHLNTLYLEILRAVAKGYEEDDAGTISERLLPIVNGPILRMAQEREDRMQADVGFATGGAAEAYMVPGDLRSTRSRIVSDPA